MVGVPQGRGRRTRSVGQRAGTLVAISGPYHGRLTRQLERVPLATALTAGARQAFYVGMTTEPHRAVAKVVNRATGGPPTTPEQVAARRRLMLLGNAATIVAGMAVQRAINHGMPHGHVREAGRIVGTQLAIGGAAAAITNVTDMALGKGEGSVPNRRALTSRTVAVIALAQRRALRRAVPLVTLPQEPRRVVVPVKNGWRVRDKELVLLQ